jgi:hypothetical protein
MESDSILGINDNDVVSGRGSGGNRHPGNIYFRELIKSNKAYYLSLSKNQKMDVARAIYDKISSLDPPGRFLNKNPETEKWYIIKKDRALEKISQALREKPVALKKGRSSGFVDKKGFGMIDPATMILGRGFPHGISGPNSSAPAEDVYSSNQSKMPYGQIQGPSQMTMAQKMQYQRQLNIMDMMHGGTYSASMLQRNMFPSVPGVPYSGYPSQIAGAGYPTQFAYSDNGGYMDRYNYNLLQNSMMMQSTKQGEQALSKHENITGSSSSNFPLASIPDHHRTYLAASSDTSAENPQSPTETIPHAETSIHANNGVSSGKDMENNNSQHNMDPKHQERKLSLPNERAEATSD